MYRNRTYTFGVNLTSANNRMSDGEVWNFAYDNLDRLTAVEENNQEIMNMAYATNGNITSKTGVSSYTYNSSVKPHAVQSVSNSDGLVELEEQDITYNLWGKVSTIWHYDQTDFYYYTAEYGPDLEKVSSRYDKTYHIEYEKFQWGDYEEKTTDGVTTSFYYVNGGDGLAGLHTVSSTQGGTETHTAAVMTDHLGSIISMADNGDLCYDVHYDVWGNREVGLPFYYSIERGFTGHDHIDGIGLIDMRGRMYDPALGRFLSPDAFVQSPTNPQNFNRYSYCLNNPLKYTDPSGESIIGAVALGALIGTYIGGVLSNEGEKNPLEWNYKSLDTWCYMACGLYVGAMSGAAGGYIASSGIPFANTLSMVSSSLVNSVGTWGYSGMQTDISINFGFGSYNFRSGKFDYLFDGNNESYEDLGYIMGGIGNFSDILRGTHDDKALLQTVKKSIFDMFGHTETTMTDGTILTDFGPSKFEKFLWSRGRNNWTLHDSEGQWSQAKDIPGNRLSPITVKHLNMKNMQRYSNYLNNHKPIYNVLINNCSMQAARALTLSGVPVLGFHPYLLHLQIAGGLRSYMFNYIYADGL
ncbi:MAG: RHS repeat-associated core domain-containing protein [Bacteroidaceae bacterium]|nr:RHS repeat-associated core domain-containing protein [Bacteroidaceae bacterium]